MFPFSSCLRARRSQSTHSVVRRSGSVLGHQDVTLEHRLLLSALEHLPSAPPDHRLDSLEPGPLHLHRERTHDLLALENFVVIVGGDLRSRLGLVGVSIVAEEFTLREGDVGGELSRVSLQDGRVGPGVGSGRELETGLDTVVEPAKERKKQVSSSEREESGEGNATDQ